MPLAMTDPVIRFTPNYAFPKLSASTGGIQHSEENEKIPCKTNLCRQSSRIQALANIHKSGQKSSTPGCMESRFKRGVDRRYELPQNGSVAGKPVAETRGNGQAGGPGRIKEQIMATNVPCFIATQIQHGVGHILGGERTAGQERSLRHSLLGLLQSVRLAGGVFQHSLEHGRGSGIRGHHVHADAIAPKLQSCGSDQAFERGLGDAVSVGA